MPNAETMKDLQQKVVKGLKPGPQKPRAALFFDEERAMAHPTTMVKAFHAGRVEKAEDDCDREVQKSGDKLYMMAELYKATQPDRRVGNVEARAWAMRQPEAGRYLKSVRKYLKAAGETDDRITKALDTADTNNGAEFVPTNFSGEFIEDYRTMTFVHGVHRHIRMTSGTFELPFTGATQPSRLLSEATSDATHTETNHLTAIDHVTDKRTLTAKKLGFREVLSEELTEDSIVPMIPWMEEEAKESAARGFEQAVISGDTTGTHQDYDVDNASGNATDSRRSWIGWRKAIAALGSAEIDMGNAKPTTEELLNVMAAMGRFGTIAEDMIWVMAPKARVWFLGLAEVLASGAYSGKLRGEFQEFMGSRAFVSQHVPTNLHDTGVNTNGGDNDTTSVMLINTKRWVIGDRRDLRIKVVENEVSDQKIMVVTERVAYSYIDNYAAQPIAGALINCI